ncbi:unnamed protein product, partial [Rotaria sp. Silwood1]
MRQCPGAGVLEFGLDFDPDKKKPDFDVWHTDVTCSTDLPTIDMLYAKNIPKQGGGDTLWENMVENREQQNERSNEPVVIAVVPQSPKVTQNNIGSKIYQDPSFMYVRLLREILVSMDTSNSDIRRELIIECCKRYANDSLELTYVDELDVEYTAERAIWWYTRPTFMYRMLNQALFTQDVDIMYKMRFFIKDLHQQLEALHSDYIKTLSSKCITVYRGVSLPDDTFEQIQQNIDGLISFNTFLSTSTERRVALAFASQKLKQP